MIEHKNDDANLKFLEDAAKFFENRPTGGDDMAFWANVVNADICRGIAIRMEALLLAEKERIDARRKSSDTHPSQELTLRGKSPLIWIVDDL